ncbi:TetR/AcrR family transcriptional regulator [Rhizohabitans arisaemae]|uniref:TetR/AcrR family transcriptional regulator n=1 Tax=Rhizohabitans arisaemae TaxID=2720610 RepID=UPI0024B08CC1|nr:TetR/AcrR family transcriptional regulator [Rhizohabitans arisaemae]
MIPLTAAKAKEARVAEQEQAAGRGSSTRDRLIDSAVRLFGEKGFEATSLRAVTDAADSNVAAVNYHFGSKEGLLRAVIDGTMRAVNEERRRRLDELEARSPVPSVAELVRAFVEPGVALTTGHGVNGSVVERFIGRMMGESDPRVRQIFADQVDRVEGRYLAAMARALPGRDEGDVRFAYTSMLGLLSLHQSGVFTAVEWPRRQTSGAQREGSEIIESERLVDFITGGILSLFSGESSR